jgi:hypothetical protein
MIPSPIFGPSRTISQGTRVGYDLKMRNRWILFGYLALFFGLVSGYDLYNDNVYIVALVAVILTFTGLGAWVWSFQPGKDKK